ncbi:MAG TPA: D-glycero-beta-D-manno-heptose 1,7-bisphosphate 7-phosphatase [Ideonella sp.]|uniref:D-glycero-beta-D-manno-heptose 1,7-bisphosphate 7-phosphatase n=1 Tax=Ideonella sp. TaxID=1929293 RepID=UPI002CB29357|nr:D-glycero-beta-D-manno-heptose 1,7-bisphosphate 7-phosphatase [Ideonella sp.]HSI48427.1 D-glycero-beta-D-manno-heptose 1,7-bisphosphate 7-phosphatase [Ideonella sp.]
MRAAFLDRDGVVNIDRGYVHRWEEFEFVPGAAQAMARLQRAGWRLVIVTNQSGIARGYFNEAQFQALTGRMLQALAEAGVDAAAVAVYHCPHHPHGRVPTLAVDCDCRKPAPGMILRAAAEHGLSLADSILVGDKPSDIAAARLAGVGRAFLVHSDNPESVVALAKADVDAVFDKLTDCVDMLLSAADWAQ